MKDLSKGSSKLLERFNQSPKSNKEEESSNIFGMKNVHGDNNIRNLSLFELTEAPKEWNFYKPIEDDKMMELIESIEKNGLLHPIVVWEQSDDEYMILAGHNRAKAFKYLSEMDNGHKYRKIPALIKKKDEISAEDAREIIIDTNWVQRTLSAIEKSKSIVEKYMVLQNKTGIKKNQDGQGQLRDIVAKDFEISGRSIDNYRKLDRLIPPLKTMLEDNSISVSAAVKLSGLTNEIQEFILDKYKDKIHRRYIKKINDKKTKEELIEIFEGEDEKYKVSFDVGERYKEIYQKMTNTERKLASKKIEKIIETIGIDRKNH